MVNMIPNFFTDITSDVPTIIEYLGTVFAYGQTASGKTYVSSIT